jgi:hypothetical protein
MKTLKPIMLVASGMLLAFIFAFKSNSNTPIKEYATIYNNAIDIFIFFPDQTEKRYEIKPSDSRKEINKILNEASKDGWVLVTTSAPEYNRNILYLERDKK